MNTRFWDKVEKTDGCWLWTAGRDPYGYGRVRADGRNLGAHRVSWMMEHGDIPSGYLVCHTCDNPPCVRPDHLFLGTYSDNMRDAAQKGRLAPWATDNRGSRNGSAKNDEDRILLIRELVAQGVKQAEISRSFGISSGCVSDIVNRRSWRHI